MKHNAEKIAFRNNQDKYALHISRSSWSRNKSITNQQEEHTIIQQQQKQEPGRTLTPGSSFCRWRPQRRGWRHREGQVVLATRGSQQRRARNLFYSLTSNPRYNFPFSYIITLCVSLLMYKLYAHGLFTIETLCTITL